MSRKLALVFLSLLLVCVVSLAVNEISGTSKTGSVEVDGDEYILESFDGFYVVLIYRLSLYFHKKIRMADPTPGFDHLQV